VSHVEPLSVEAMYALRPRRGAVSKAVVSSPAPASDAGEAVDAVHLHFHGAVPEPDQIVKAVRAVQVAARG
jgi:hypothetical protein